MSTTLARFDAGLVAAMRARDRLTVETYRTLKASAYDLALTENRHGATELDFRAAALAWRKHLMKLLALYASLGAAGVELSDRLVHDVAQCDAVLGPDQPMTAELSRLLEAAEAALNARS